MLGTLLGRKDRSAAQDQVERFGDARIPRRLGVEILRATPARRNHLQGLRDKLSSMTLEEKDELVDRLLARVALFVYDLPASENNHHSGRFGLLDHLLEVAHDTVRELSAPGFEVSPEPSTNHRERPLWVYAGMVGAIAHDLGKPLDLDVSAPGKGTSWDPKAEPLRLFCERHDLSETGPALWHFHPKRGLRGHEKNINVLLPVVLTAEARNYLGPRLGSVIDAMTRDEEWKTQGGRLHPAKAVVRIIRRVDGTTADQNSSEPARSQVPPVVVPLARPIPPKPKEAPEQKTLPFPMLADRPVRVPRPPAALAESPAAGELRSDDPSAEEEPVFVPKDFWPEPIPDRKKRTGDPVEIEARLRAELEPARFLSTLRRMVTAHRLSRNNLCTEIYIRPDFVWFMLPRAFRRVALINHLPFDGEVLKRMLSVLQGIPQVSPGSSRRVQVFVKPRPDGSAFEAVRIKTPGFLTARQLESLGVYGYEIRALEENRGATPGKQEQP